jgi:hypothetical protein
MFEKRISIRLSVVFVNLMSYKTIILYLSFFPHLLLKAKFHLDRFEMCYNDSWELAISIYSHLGNSRSTILEMPVVRRS